MDSIDVPRRVIACVLLAAGLTAAPAVAAPAVAGGDLPARLGMFVENAERSGEAVTVRTRGVVLELRDDGILAARARIPSARELVTFRIDPPPAAAWEIQKWDADRAVVASPGVEVEVHGDSLVQIRVSRPARLRAAAGFRPEYRAAKDGARLLADARGGFGIYLVGGEARIGPEGAAHGEGREDPPGSSPGAGPAGDGGDPRPQDQAGEPARGPEPELFYDLGGGAEVWISFFPPRPADPRRLAQSIAHEGHAAPFPDAAYPSTAIVEDASRHCQIFALHAYFWEEAPDAVKPTTGKYAGRRCSWLTPRHVPADPARWTRLVADVRRTGMKLVVYLSPYYSTAPDIFAEMRRVLEEYGVDGLYFDGVSMDLRRSYEVLRRARGILGDDRILYVHASSDPFRSTTLFCPTLDAYADFVLRGEAGRGGLPLDTFLRYVVSGWNLGNDVGVWCYYGSAGEHGSGNAVPSPEDIDAALRNHARLWRRSGWVSRDAAWSIASFDRRYGRGLEELIHGREAIPGPQGVRDPVEPPEKESPAE